MTYLREIKCLVTCSYCLKFIIKLTQFETETLFKNKKIFVLTVTFNSNYLSASDIEVL